VAAVEGADCRPGGSAAVRAQLTPTISCLTFVANFNHQQE
jgi:hypothetical protein